MLGGCKIIDFKRSDLTSAVSGSSPASVKIEGVYDSIESNYGKMTVISGLVIDNFAFNEFAANIGITGSNYNIIVENNPAEYYIVQIDQSDNVTATKYTE